jgi:hypothetical protein
MADVHFSTDVSKAEAVMGPWLRRDPVANNVALSLLALQADQPQAQARFWWATRGDHPAGFALQVGTRRPLHIRSDDLSRIPDLAAAIQARAPDVLGVEGQAPAVAAFGASWASLTHTPVTISLFNCYYHLAAPRPPPPARPAPPAPPPPPPRPPPRASGRTTPVTPAGAVRRA